jgi:hypothetical protein
MRRGLREEIAQLLAEDPDISVGKLQKRLRARRADVLAAVQTVRGAQQSHSAGESPGNRFPQPGNPVPVVSPDHSRGETTVQHNEPTEDLAILDAFEEVGELLEQPVDLLLAVLSQVQRSPELKAEGARVFQLVGTLLAFKSRFEVELRDTGEFLEAFAYLVRAGSPPGPGVVEELLANPERWAPEEEIAAPRSEPTPIQSAPEPAGPGPEETLEPARWRLSAEEVLGGVAGLGPQK